MANQKIMICPHCQEPSGWTVEKLNKCITENKEPLCVNCSETLVSSKQPQTKTKTVHHHHHYNNGTDVDDVLLYGLGGMILGDVLDIDFF